jgi:hypothetical protein
MLQNKSCAPTFFSYVAGGLQQGKHRFSRPVKSALAVLLIGAVLLLNALAASPALHKLIHHDADKPDHECAVTLFAHGQVDSPVVEVGAVIPPALFEFLPLAPVSVFNAPVETLPLGRGPPVSLLHS